MIFSIAVDRLVRAASKAWILLALGAFPAIAAPPPSPSPLPVLRYARGEDGKVTLAFSPIARAKTYAVRVVSDANSEVIDHVETSDYTVHGLRNGRPYRFAVCAEFDTGRGPWSAELSATPVDQPDWKALREAFESSNPTRNSNPFLMVHGRESEAELRAIVRAAYDGGFEGVTLHPTDYHDYLGPGQWNRWKVIFDQARRLGLAVWQQDDRHYPSGFAGGKVTAAHPEFGRTMLVEAKQQLLAGPAKGFALNVSSLLAGRDFLVAVAAYPESGEPLDLTDRVAQGTLAWDVPAGEWKLFVIKAVWGNGDPYSGIVNQPRGYIDFLNPRAVDAYIEAIYGATYAQFPQEFGRTFKGFFSDEAPVEFRQFTPDLLQRFEKAKGYSIRRYLPSLWNDLGNSDRKVRSDYRDFIREQNATVFFDRSRRWCHEHGVQLIGHVIEDHQQDMRRLESLDIPGCDSIFSQWSDPDGDVYWRQTKMATSVAHYNGSRNDLALIEHFAATGWRMGLSEMKRMMDWSTAMGFNQIVPCGMDTQTPPIWEVAPDFWLHGVNPQWPYFRDYQTAANRMTLLMRGGRHVAPAIVLDTTESQWAKDGKNLAWQHGARDDLWKSCAAMSQAQADFDLIPYAVFADARRTTFENGRLRIGKEDYRAVVLPPVDFIPATVIERLRDFYEASGVVVALNHLPALSCDGRQDDRVRAAVQRIWGPIANRRGKSAIPDYGGLRATLAGFNVPDVRISPETKKLLYCHRQLHGQDLYFFANTGSEPIAADVELRGVAGAPTLWDPVSGKILQGTAPVVASAIAGPPALSQGSVQFKLDLSEYESTFVVLEPGSAPKQAVVEAKRPSTLVLRAPWRATNGPAAHHRVFTTNVQLPADWPPKTPARLELRGASQILAVEVNGKPVGRRFCSPYRFDVGNCLRPGDNHIQVDRVGRIVLPNNVAPSSKVNDDEAATPCTEATIIRD